MPSINNWWSGEIDWATPAGRLLRKFLAALPKDRSFHFTLYGSAPLQLTVDPQLMSVDVDLFSEDDEDVGKQRGRPGIGIWLTGIVATIIIPSPFSLQSMMFVSRTILLVVVYSNCVNWP